MVSFLFQTAAGAGKLLDDRENIALTDNDQLFAIDLYFGTRVFAGDDLITGLNLHDDLFAVHNAARAYGQNLCYLGLFLRSARMMPEAVVSSASTILMTTRSERGLSFMIYSS